MKQATLKHPILIFFMAFLLVAFYGMLKKSSGKVSITVSTFAGSGVAGSANGTGTASSFNNPKGVAMDASGNLYVADHLNKLARKITRPAW